MCNEHLIIQQYEKEYLITMFTEYKRLGGNGYVGRIVEEILQYPPAKN